MRQTISVNQYEELQEQYNFEDQQYGSINCYHNPLYYNNTLYMTPPTLHAFPTLP